MIECELHVVNTYVMLNYPEVILYVQRFEVLAHVKYPHISESVLSKYRDRELTKRIHFLSSMLSYFLQVW